MMNCQLGIRERLGRSGIARVASHEEQFSWLAHCCFDQLRVAGRYFLEFLRGRGKLLALGKAVKAGTPVADSYLEMLGK